MDFRDTFDHEGEQGIDRLFQDFHREFHDEFQMSDPKWMDLSAAF